MIHKLLTARLWKLREAQSNAQTAEERANIQSQIETVLNALDNIRKA